jgi:hypothetical protein
MFAKAIDKFIGLFKLVITGFPEENSISAFPFGEG